jgi:hypothetical protein
MRLDRDGRLHQQTHDRVLASQHLAAGCQRIVNRVMTSANTRAPTLQRVPVVDRRSDTGDAATIRGAGSLHGCRP